MKAIRCMLTIAMLLLVISASRAAAEDTLQGTLVGIMEVTPLRLKIETEDNVRTVQLTDETSIVEDGKAVGVNRLREGQRLVVLGKPSKDRPKWLVARKITIERK
jgi:hypothetical protein